MQEPLVSATVQEPIAITLLPERLTVTAGGAAEQVLATIKNQTNIVDSYALELTGLTNPTWYSLSLRQLTLFPGEQKTINIAFTVPADFEALDGRYDYALRVKSRVENSRVSAAEGALIVHVPEAINLRLKRETIRGQIGQNDLTVTNRTLLLQEIVLTAEDEEGLLDFSFEPAILQVPPGKSQVVGLTLRLHEGQPLTATHAFRYTLCAQTIDERERSNMVEGQFLYTPAQVRMELLPQRVKGVEGRFNLNVANPGSHAVTLEVSATSPEDALDMVFQQPTLSLQPGTSVILPLIVRLKPDLKPELRSYSFTVAVRQGGTGGAAPEIGPPVIGELIYSPALEFGISIERGPGSAGQSDYVVKLTNPSLSGVRLSLRADDPGGALDLFFGGQVAQLVLPPGGSLEVPLLARLKVAPPAQKTTYPFTVTAHIIPDNGGSELDKTAQADLIAGAAGPILRMDLLPPQAHGETGRFQLRLTSGVGNPLQVVLRGRDEAAALQYAFEPARLQLLPDTVELVDVTVRLRQDPLLSGPQTYPFEVIAWVPGLGTDGATTRAGTWVYTPPAEPPPARLALRLRPTRAIGDDSQYHVTLVNEGPTPLTAVLRANDDAEALAFVFQVPRVQLQPREVAEVSLIARSRDGLPLPGPYRYPFEVAAWVPGSVTGASSVDRGELIIVQAPPKRSTFLPWQRLGLAALLIVWIIVPFVLDIIIRNNATLLYLLPLLYQYTPALGLPLVGLALYGSSPEQLRGWRGVLVGLLGAGSVITYLLPLVIPAGAMIGGFAAIPFINLLLLPALIVVLLI